MKKVTMRDVAKAAGVSVATVSYVINNNDKESILEDTKKRVIKAIDELNYIPDLTARALSRKKSGLVGIFIMDNHAEPLPWKKCSYSEFISELIKILYDIGYHAIVEHLDPSNCKLDIIYERALDGVFILGISEQYIYNTTNIFKVPIILVDSYIEDTLFHKVLADYETAISEGMKILGEKEPFIVVDSANSKVLIDKLCQSNKLQEKNIHVISTEEDLYRCLKNNNHRKGIIFNEFLAILAQNHIAAEQLAVICLSGNEYLLSNYKYKLFFNNKEKAALAAEIMIDYINKDYHSNKYSFVKPVLISDTAL